MSSEDNGPDREESGDGGQGGQPRGGQPQGGQTPPGQGQQGGQPQGGQGGQPQGGQPPGGQPQGQPAGGQPQGQPAAGQPQGQPGAGYQQGGYQESVTDIFSKPTTMEQIKMTVVFYALAGVAIGFAGFITGTQVSVGGGFGSSQSLGYVAAMAAMLSGPILSVPFALRIVDALQGVEAEQQIFATAAASTFAGTLVVTFLSYMFTLIGTDNMDDVVEFGDMFIIAIVAGIGSALAAAGVGYAVFNLGSGQRM